MNKTARGIGILLLGIATVNGTAAIAAPPATASTPKSTAATAGTKTTEAIGRLFFTPERRTAMDRARQLNIQEQQQVAQSDVVTVNGLVTRSSGKRTAWVNGMAITENSTTTVRAVPTAAPGAVQVTAGEQGATTVTIGTTVNRATGEKSDGLHGGRIDIRRRTP